jgi:hypothetical protein
MRSLILALSVLFTLPTNPPTGYAGPSRTQYKTKKSAVENGAVPQISIRSDSTVINLLRAHDELLEAIT